MKKKIKLNEYNSEIVGIKIKTLKNKEISIFSYYNSPSSVLKMLFEQIQAKYKNYLICGDLNSKSLMFNCKSQNTNGTVLETIIMDTNGQIINNGNVSPLFILIIKKQSI